MTKYIIGLSIGSFIMLVFLVYYFFWLFKKHSFKKLVKDIGRSAETKINSDIKTWTKHTQNKFLPSSLYKYNDNKVFEVDSIVITSKVIIVVEIKSIKGGIRGKAYDSKWSKILGKNVFYITNAIIQNDKHIEHIIKIIDLKVPIISLIVFSNRAEYLDIQNIPSHVVITRHIDLFNKLDEIETFLKRTFSETDVKNLTKKIKSYSSKNFKDKKLHKQITQKGKAWK